MKRKTRILITENIERILDKYGKPRCPECQRCSRCCDRVIATTQGEIENEKAYLERHPELKAKIRKILAYVPDDVDMCPFLDPTIKSNNRCLLYNTDVRFYVCKIFSCGMVSDYLDNKENWTTEANLKGDPVINCDLRFTFFGAKEDWVTRVESRVRSFMDFFGF